MRIVNYFIILYYHYQLACLCFQDLNFTIVTSKDGHEYLDDDDDSYYETVFIISDFESKEFNDLKQTHIRIVGPPVITTIAETNKVKFKIIYSFCC